MQLRDCHIPFDSLDLQERIGAGAFGGCTLQALMVLEYFYIHTHRGGDEGVLCGNNSGCETDDTGAYCRGKCYHYLGYLCLETGTDKRTLTGEHEIVS